MATSNKFSNPDTPAVDCLVIKPLQAIFCLPLVCCAWGLRNRKKRRAAEGGSGPAARDPAPPPPRAQGDASLPPSQWPASWHHPEGLPRAGAEAEEGREEASPGGQVH